MVLVDTSVWAGHLASPNATLQELLKRKQVLMHSAVLGELASGNLPRRARTIADLRLVDAIGEVSADEALEFLEIHRLYGTGIGWIDVQLLASSVLAHAQLWSRDKPLCRATRRLGVDF